MIDIPNIVTLPIEIGVALLILWMDQRQRQREADNILRFQEQQKQARETEIRQRERFNNWQQENSKRQIMLLESIISTLDDEKIDDFKTQVGSRYTQEINQDMEDLDSLLEKKRQTDTIDPELEANIESKIDEIESGKEFVEHFLPQDAISQINEIATSAKLAYKVLRELPEKLSMSIPDQEGEKINIKFEDEEYEVDPQNKDEIDKIKDRFLNNYKKERSELAKSLNVTVKETLDEVAQEIQKNLPDDDTIPTKLMDAIKASIIGSMGIDKKSKKENDEEAQDAESDIDDYTQDKESD